MSLATKLKGIIKKPADKATFGTNPMDPWSAKAGISESASLNAYLKSRGINPEFVSTQTKISHAKSQAFLRWKQQHESVSHEIHNEAKKKMSAFIKIKEA